MMSPSESDIFDIRETTDDKESLQVLARMSQNSVNHTNSLGEGVLHIVCKHRTGFQGLLALLLEQDHNPLLEDNSGQSPLYILPESYANEGKQGFVGLRFGDSWNLKPALSLMLKLMSP